MQYTNYLQWVVDGWVGVKNGISWVLQWLRGLSQGISIVSINLVPLPPASQRISPWGLYRMD